MSEKKKVVRIYPEPSRKERFLHAAKEAGGRFAEASIQELMQNKEMQRLYRARKSPYAVFLGVVAVGLLISAGYHEVKNLIFGVPNNNKVVQHSNPVSHSTATVSPKNTGIVAPSSLNNNNKPTPQKAISAPAFHLTPPKFVFESGLNGLKAPEAANQNAARFAWLDSLSGPKLNNQSVLAEIQKVTTPDFFTQLSNSFSLPTDKQTWIDVKVYPVQKNQDGSWLLNTIAEAEDSSGQELQLHQYETMVQEGGTWLVQQVAYDPPTS